MTEIVPRGGRCFFGDGLKWVDTMPVVLRGDLLVGDPFLDLSMFSTGSVAPPCPSMPIFPSVSAWTVLDGPASST